MINITAKITGVKYNPLLCKKLDVKSLENKHAKILEPLKKEAKANGFKIKINDEFIN